MPVEVVQEVKEPLVSIVIPSRDGSRGENVPRLLEALKAQHLGEAELIVVTGERPNGHARHLGAGRASAEVLVFIDDDAGFEASDTVRRLVDVVQDDRTIGLAGVAQRLPPGLSRLQRWVITQLPRTESDIVDELTDSDMVTTLCLAIRRDLYDAIGGMNTWMIAGVDPELRQRVRHAGHRVVVVPQTWVYHPMPTRLDRVLRYAFVKGTYSAWQHRFARELSFDCTEGHDPDEPAQRSLPYRVARKAIDIVRALVMGRPVRVAHDLAYSLGYTAGLRQRWPEPERS